MSDKTASYADLLVLLAQSRQREADLRKSLHQASAEWGDEKSRALSAARERDQLRADLEHEKNLRQRDRKSIALLSRDCGKLITESITNRSLTADLNKAQAEHLHDVVYIETLEAQLKTAQEALRNIRNYIRSSSGADWDNVRSFCTQALAQIAPEGKCLPESI